MRNTKKTIIYSLVITTTFACSHKKFTNFEISNESNFEIDSILISCSGTEYLDKKTITSLAINGKGEIKLNMEGLPKDDGNYYIEIFYKGFKKTKDFGYYSNGSPSSSKYNILIIDKDSILIKETL